MFSYVLLSSNVFCNINQPGLGVKKLKLGCKRMKKKKNNQRTCTDEHADFKAIDDLSKGTQVKAVTTVVKLIELKK